MATKLTRLTHKIAIQLQPVAESCNICSSCSRRPVRKFLDKPSCEFSLNILQWFYTECRFRVRCSNFVLSDQLSMLMYFVMFLSSCRWISVSRFKVDLIHFVIKPSQVRIYPFSFDVVFLFHMIQCRSINNIKKHSNLPIRFSCIYWSLFCTCKLSLFPVSRSLSLQGAACVMWRHTNHVCCYGNRYVFLSL
jgi:hypothetical protein